MKRNLELFGTSSELPPNAPLAEKLRPSTWVEYRGIEQIEENLRAQLLSGKGKPPSLILWGPPGSGKTTLARLIGKNFGCHFLEFSAVLMSVQDIRAVAADARQSQKPVLLFVDEIHRLNKGQQDAFLPHVERGTFSLIGATTENPSFSLTNALLSRCRVIVLRPIAPDDMRKIAANALSKSGMSLSPRAEDLLINAAQGDARKLLGYIESLSAKEANKLSDEEIERFLSAGQEAFYDRSGEEHYNTVSAFIKSMRGSSPDAALFWCFRMIEAGEDPRFIIRRMIIFASEDIGNADPRALQLAVATADAFERLGLPEGKIPIAHCVTYLASAPKSNRSYLAMHAAVRSVREHPKVTVPLHLRNAPTELMKALKYGADYQYPHDEKEGFVSNVSYFPEEVGDLTFYEPSSHGAEPTLGERLTLWRKSKS